MNFNSLLYYLTVDPGWSTGWAMWRNSNILIPTSGCIFVDRNLDTEGRLADMWFKFENLVGGFNSVNLLVMESTSFWDKSSKSITSHKKGDIHTLSILIGGYLDISRKAGIPFILKSSNFWKGNMTDPQVRRRVRYVNGVTYSNPHICDAVGIGLSLQKKFNIRTQKIGKKKTIIRHKAVQKKAKKVYCL